MKTEFFAAPDMRTMRTEFMRHLHKFPLYTTASDFSHAFHKGRAIKTQLIPVTAPSYLLLANPFTAFIMITDYVKVDPSISEYLNPAFFDGKKMCDMLHLCAPVGVIKKFLSDNGASESLINSFHGEEPLTREEFNERAKRKPDSYRRRFDFPHGRGLNSPGEDEHEYIYGLDYGVTPPFQSPTPWLRFYRYVSTIGNIYEFIVYDGGRVTRMVWPDYGEEVLAMDEHGNHISVEMGGSVYDTDDFYLNDRREHVPESEAYLPVTELVTNEDGEEEEEETEIWEMRDDLIRFQCKTTTVRDDYIEEEIYFITTAWDIHTYDSNTGEDIDLSETVNI